MFSNYSEDILSYEYQYFSIKLTGLDRMKSENPHNVIAVEKFFSSIRIDYSVKINGEKKW